MEVLNSLASLHELPELTVAACSQTSDQRREIILSILRDLLDSGEPTRILLAKSTQKYPEQSLEDTALSASVVVMGAVVVMGKDQTANLLAIGCNRECETLLKDAKLDSQRCMKSLLDFVHQQLAQSQISFVQAMRDLQTGDADLLSDCGYQKLAELDYLCVSVDSFKVAEPTSDERNSGRNTDELQWENFSQATDRLGSQALAFKQLLETVDTTYEGSLDCPAIAAYRDTAQVIEGYQAAAGYDPRLWFFCHASSERVEQRDPIGCLLLTKHPAGGSVEVTYMGIAPRWRGKGYASQLLHKTWIEASSRGIPHLTLAVDRSKCPARKVYQRHGFQCLLSEAVWGRKIKPEFTKKES